MNIEHQLFSRVEAERFREMACELLEISNNIDQSIAISGCSAVAKRRNNYFDEEIGPRLATIAGKEYRERRRRNKFLPGELFAEPGWDILLDLYFKTAKGERVSVTSLCLAAAVPNTTGLRWISVLESFGFISRTDAVHDNRVTFIELTMKGYDSLTALLKDRISKSEEFSPRFLLRT